MGAVNCLIICILQNTFFLCSAEEIIKYRFGTTWGWKFWVHYPFNEEFSKLKNTGFCSSFRRWLL